MTGFKTSDLTATSELTEASTTGAGELSDLHEQNIILKAITNNILIRFSLIMERL